MKRIILQAALAAMLAGPAAAADLGAPLAPEAPEVGTIGTGWQFTAAAYLWMPGVSGDVGVAGLGPVEVDADFVDILENLDLGFMAVAEARYDRFGVFGDLMYTKLSVDGTGPNGLFAADVTNQMITGTVMANYRVLDQGKTSVDVMAGARIWGVTGDLEVTSTNNGGPQLGLERDGDKFWVDPMIGVKTRVQGASPWYLNGWAMVGGFGVSSEIDWDLYAGLGYEITDSFSLVAGYRGVGVDYSDDGFTFDVIQHGPVLGGVFRF
jgi:opacity protein-like surface antigen